MPSPLSAAAPSQLGRLSPLKTPARASASKESGPQDSVRFTAGLPVAPPVSAAEVAAAAQASKKSLGRKLAEASAYTFLAGTGLVTTATVALANPAALGPIGPPLNQAILSTMPEGVQAGYNWAMAPDPRAEDPSQWGQMYLVSPDTESGHFTVLANNGETSARGNDIPAEAIEDGQIVVAFEGIQGTQGGYSRAHHQLFYGDNSYVELDQNIIGIHQGFRPRGLDDLTRMADGYMNLKDMQAGRPISAEEIFANDPSVETGYNIIRQALDQDLDVLLVAHSGGALGGAQALNLLEAHGYGDEISEHVRVMSMAGAASRQDMLEAGVQPDNALSIGMQQDIVAQLGATYVDPHAPLAGIQTILEGVSKTEGPLLGDYHSPNKMIVPKNADHVRDFFEHGIGGSFMAS